MNRSSCQRECDVVEALRGGSFPDELRSHVGSCAICAETQPVAQMLLQAASVVRVDHELSDAGLVWRRVQARKQEIALKRATRPLIYMRALSVVYVVLFAAWLLHSFWRSSSMEQISRWSGSQDGTACFGAAIAVVAIAIGAWFLLHDGRRSGERVPSM